MRIDPGREMAAVGKLAARSRVAVRQQDRVAPFVGGDLDPIARRYVGPVEEIGDATKPLGLALRAEIVARGVETAERGVELRSDPDGDVEGEGVGRIEDDERVVRLDPVAVGRQSGAVQRDRNQLQFLAVEAQGCRKGSWRRAGYRVAPHLKPGFDERLLLAERERQLDRN